MYEAPLLYISRIFDSKPMIARLYMKSRLRCISPRSHLSSSVNDERISRRSRFNLEGECRLIVVHAAYEKICLVAGNIPDAWTPTEASILIESNRGRIACNSVHRGGQCLFQVPTDFA